MSKENIYMITEETYEATVNERILLYGFICQMAFLTKRAETIEDFFHLKEATAIFGSQAEELFETWDIPGRYVVYGDPATWTGSRSWSFWTTARTTPTRIPEMRRTRKGFPSLK